MTSVDAAFVKDENSIKKKTQTEVPGWVVRMIFFAALASYLVKPIYDPEFFSSLVLESGSYAELHAWLFGVVLQCVESLGGDKGLIVLNLLCCFSFSVSIAYVFYLVSKNWFFASFFSALITLGVFSQSPFNPNIFLLILFAGLLVLLLSLNKTMNVRKVISIALLLFLGGFIWHAEELHFVPASLVSFNFAVFLILMCVIVVEGRKEFFTFLSFHQIVICSLLFCSVIFPISVNFAMILAGITLMDIVANRLSQEVKKGPIEGLLLFSQRIKKLPSFGITWVMFCFALVNVYQLLQGPLLRSLLPTLEVSAVKALKLVPLAYEPMIEGYLLYSGFDSNSGVPTNEGRSGQRMKDLVELTDRTTEYLQHETYFEAILTAKARPVYPVLKNSKNWVEYRAPVPERVKENPEVKQMSPSDFSPWALFVRADVMRKKSNTNDNNVF